MTFEDLSTFTEVDGALFVQTATRSTATNLENNSVGYVYKDYTAGKFGDFEHLITINHTDSVANYNRGCAHGVYCVTNNPETYSNLANGLGVFQFRSSTTNSPKYIYIKDFSNNNSSVWTEAELNTVYYLKIIRNGTTATCRIYADAARTDEIATLEITCETTTYRYLMCGYAHDGTSDEGHDMDGYVENIDLQEPIISTQPIAGSGNTWIFYSGNNYPTYAVGCWCSRWDDDNENVIFETFLASSQRDTLFAHITPQAVRQLWNILGEKKFLDTTFSSGNTLRISPQHGFGISSLRQERVIAVTNAIDWHIPNSKYLGIKIEGVIL